MEQECLAVIPAFVYFFCFFVLKKKTMRLQFGKNYFLQATSGWQSNSLPQYITRKALTILIKKNSGIGKFVITGCSCAIMDGKFE